MINRIYALISYIIFFLFIFSLCMFFASVVAKSLNYQYNVSFKLISLIMSLLTSLIAVKYNYIPQKII